MKIQFDIKSYTLWIAFIAVPLLLNGAVSKTFVAPQRARLEGWREAEKLTVMRPDLQAILTESHTLRLQESEQGSIVQDFQGALQTLQHSAARAGVQILETRTEGQGGDATSSLPLQLEVKGNFNKLARWMSDVESQKTFRFDTWSFKTNTDQTLQLSAKITVFLGES